MKALPSLSQGSTTVTEADFFMLSIQEILKNKQLPQKSELDKVQHEYQHYGLLICQVLQLDNKYKGRIMGFIKRYGNGYGLHDKVNQLLNKQKFLEMSQDARIRYLFGSFKKSL